VHLGAHPGTSVTGNFAGDMGFNVVDSAIAPQMTGRLKREPQ
jgi:hypothetical protein